MLTDNKYLDKLHFRASKGSAVHYLSYIWKAPLENFITAGICGNDIYMLKGKVKGIVAVNHSPELEELRKYKYIYFAKSTGGNGCTGEHKISSSVFCSEKIYSHGLAAWRSSDINDVFTYC